MEGAKRNIAVAVSAAAVELAAVVAVPVAEVVLRTLLQTLPAEAVVEVVDVVEATHHRLPHPRVTAGRRRIPVVVADAAAVVDREETVAEDLTAAVPEVARLLFPVGVAVDRWIVMMIETRERNNKGQGKNEITMAKKILPEI